MIVKLNKLMFFGGKTLSGELIFKIVREKLSTKRKYQDKELLAAWLVLLHKYSNECDWPENIEIKDKTKIGDLFGYKEKLQNIHVEEKQYLQLCIDEQPSETGVFTFAVVREEQELKIEFRYSASMDEEIARNILNHYGRILQQLEDKKTVSEITLLNENEYNKIVYGWNRTEAPYPKDKTIHQLFEEQAARTPDNVAVVFEDKQLTYRELNERANYLAYAIRERYRDVYNVNLPEETLIPICVERSIEMITGILGILKAKAAYVPVNPDFSQERIEFILNDTKAKIILVHTNTADKIPLIHKDKLLTIKDNGKYHYRVTDDRLPIANSLAYVIYTSGSTGQPKGVLGEHESILNRFYWMWNEFPWKPEEVACAKSTYTFIDSVWELFGGLLKGIKTIITSDIESGDITRMVGLINKYCVTRFVAVPELLEVFPIEKLKSLIYVTSSGSKLNSSLAKRICEIQNLILINLYGSSEVAADVTCYKVEGKKYNTSIIGKPISNIKCYILDSNLNPVSIGVSGELCIGGNGLARGYLNRPELTAERFISNPFASEDDKARGRNLRLYKTGDLCRWLPDGNIEYIGRNDFQVKIRGFRIELGEIENVMVGYDGISQAVVIVKEKERNKYLVGYYTKKTTDYSLSSRSLRAKAGQQLAKPKSSGEGWTVDKEKLREYLSSKLPDYMVPAQLVYLESMPLNISGKIDRKKLPEVELAGDMDKYIAPRTQAEKRLCEIWADVLGIEEVKIGIYDNFFSLGGNSLKVILLSSKISKELGKIVSIKELFANTTIEKQAEILITKTSDIENKIERAEEKECYPAIAAQSRMYLVNKLEGNDTAYNITLAFKFQGKLDKKRLKESIGRIAEKHEAFRTSFGMKNNEVIQRIVDKVEYEYIEKAVKENEIEEEFSAFVRPFDLEKSPLFRVGLFEISHEEYIFVLDIHHSVFDGQSAYCFVEDLAKAYQGEELEVLKVRNCDYAEWEKKRKKSEEYQKQKEYWQKELSGDIELVKLPTDKPRKKEISHKGKTIRKEIDEELYAKVKELARKENITTFNVFFAAYGIVLSKYSNQKDIIVGIPSIGRAHNDIEKNIGMFVSSLPIRMNAGNNIIIKDYLAQVNLKIREGVNNQEYPLEEMLSDKRIENKGIGSLFNVMFVMAEDYRGELNIGELKVSEYTRENRAVKFELTGYISEKEENAEISYEYMTDLFEQDTIERIAGSYERVLKQIVENPEIQIGEINILSAEEYNKVIYDWNRTEAPYPKDKTIHQLFEEQAARTPDNVAVVFEDKQLTYRELNERANQLAHCIRHEYKEHWTEEVKGDTLIGIYIERSLEMLIGILGILKAGGAYVPFDSADPEKRLKFKIADCGCKMILTSSHSIDSLLFLAETDTLPLSIDSYKEEIDKFSKENPVHINKSTDLAYVIYTSGSTGKPKGVMIEHRSLVHFCYASVQRLGIGEKDRSGVFVGCYFDAFIGSVFPFFSTGASILLLSKEEHLSLDKTNKALIEKKITIISFPAKIRELFVREYESCALRAVVSGGESFTGFVKRGYIQVNEYGPTECTVASTSFEVEKEYKSVPIGKPILNAKCYIMSDNLSPAPIGVPGELYIGGDGLARGYLNRPELTAERFILNPFASEEDKAKGKNLRIYKTGDICRWLPDGNIEYIGRNDFQVKIRGFRIELGEIESAMADFEGINQAVVIVREKEGNKYPVGYYTKKTTACQAEASRRRPDDSLPSRTFPKAGQQLAEPKPPGEGRTADKDKLREYLSFKLPDYMIPAQLIYLENMPLNTSGKIDRKKLLSLDLDIAISQEYMPPVSEEEKMISKIWGRVLNLEKISIKENFFSIGGNSLNAIKLASEISKTFLRNIPVVTIFQKKTIEEQAKEAARLTATPSEDVVYLKNNEDYKETLILFPPGYSGAEAYCELAGKLNPNIRVIGLNNYLINNPNSDTADIEVILKQYLEQLENKGIFKDSKPVSLGGWSLGGNISLSALNLLKEINVKTVFLFDAVLGEEDEPEQVKELNTENPNDPDNSFFARFKDAGYSREQIVAMLERVSAGMSSLKYETTKEAVSHIKIILFKARQEAMGVNIKDEFNGWKKYYENIEKIDIQSANHFNILSESGSIDIISNAINKCLDG